MRIKILNYLLKIADIRTGEEIIARYEADAPDHVKVDKPLALVQGGNRLGMIPWLFLANSDTIKINKTAIVAVPMLSKKDAAASI